MILIKAHQIIAQYPLQHPQKLKQYRRKQHRQQFNELDGCMPGRTWYSILPSSVTTQWLKLWDGRTTTRNNRRISSVAIAREAQHCSIETERGGGTIDERQLAFVSCNLLEAYFSFYFPGFEQNSWAGTLSRDSWLPLEKPRNSMQSWQTSSWIFVAALERATDWIRYCSRAFKAA